MKKIKLTREVLQLSGTDLVLHNMLLNTKI